MRELSEKIFCWQSRDFDRSMYRSARFKSRRNRNERREKELKSDMRIVEDAFVTF